MQCVLCTQHYSLTPRFLHSPSLPLDDFSFGGMHSSSSRLGPSRFFSFPSANGWFLKWFLAFYLYIYIIIACVFSLLLRIIFHLGELYWIYLYNTDGHLVKNSKACCWYETNCMFNLLSAALWIVLLRSWFHLLLFFNGWDGQHGRSKLQVCFYFHPHCQWKKY